MVSSISSIWFISLSQVLESVQHLLHSAEFAAILWLLGPWGHPCPAFNIPHQCMHCFVIVPVLCLLFYVVTLLSLQIAILDVSLPPKP